jgi:hypothetical protein
MRFLQSSRLGMACDVLMKLFCVLCTHSSGDVRGASRQRGLAEAVKKSRGLQNRVVRR